jgi:hypothetical protein
MLFTMKKNENRELSGLSETTKAFIVIIIILIIGVIFRWSYISEEILKGFEFFSK